MLKRCKSCGCEFRPHPQVPKQTYCSAPECQRERRRSSQQKKRRDDPDYRDNDARNSKNWAVKNPGYWKQYRAEHPGYAKRNQKLQQNRNQKQRQARIAKVDTSGPLSSLPSGRYRMTPITADGIANEDAWIVEITVLTAPAGDLEA